MGADLRDLDSPTGAVSLAHLIQQCRRDRSRTYRRGSEEEDTPDLTSPGAAIRLAAAVRSRIVSEGAGETSHLSVMDRYGNAVGITQSLERSFGAKVMTPGLGFVYNGYLRTFKVENKRHPHYLRPGAMARSNAAPTILQDSAGQLTAVIGSTGSERMVSSILQVLLRLRTDEPFVAVHAPRLHATPDGEVLIEADRADPATLAALKTAGFRVKPLSAYSFQMGGLHLVLRVGDRFTGVAEPRRDGAAAGP